MTKPVEFIGFEDPPTKRIVLNIDDSEDETVYLTKRDEGAVEITIESCKNHQHGEAITHVMSKEQAAALLAWLAN